MKTNKINNQATFGTVYSSVQNNARTGFENEILKFMSKLRKETGNKILGSAPVIAEGDSWEWSAYNLAIQFKTRRNNITPNYQAEQDFMRRIQKWAHRKGFGKVESVQE